MDGLIPTHLLNKYIYYNSVKIRILINNIKTSNGGNINSKLFSKNSKPSIIPVIEDSEEFGRFIGLKVSIKVKNVQNDTLS